MSFKLAVLDVETGGKQATVNPITQFAIQIVDPLDFKILHSYDTFVKPYNNLKIEKEALDYTRVTMQQINAGIDYRELLKQIIQAVKLANKSGNGASRPVIVGHNVGFDVGFLTYLFNYANKDLNDYFSSNTLDTMTLLKMHEMGSLKNDENSRYTLTACCERMNIKLKTAHGAPADVDHTRQLLKNLYLKTRSTKNEITYPAGDLSPEAGGGVQKRSHSKRTKPYFEF